MNKKKYIKFLIIIFIISDIFTAYIVYNLYKIDQSVSSTEVRFILEKPIKESSFMIENVKDKNLLKYKDKGMLDKIYKLIENKKMVRIKEKEEFSKLKENIYEFEYNGQESFYVNIDGRVVINKDKAFIREKSRLHWLWWKYDSISDNYTHFYHVTTEPDANIIEIIKNNVY